MTPTLGELTAALPELTLRDERRLARRAGRARSLRGSEARAAAVSELAGEVATAQQRVERRRAGVPVVSYPPELPVSQRRDELAAAIEAHQVVIIAGETGSGKTTQLPKICLELGRGIRGQIGHTQPRRIAARTIAARIAEELSIELGTTVGYKVRFADTGSDDTLIKVMTDGILLTELQRDRDLLRYDTLIIDEAHERSLNIDFILGYLKQLLPRRPDLKVIITSATIDPQRFARHFATGPAGDDGVPPVVEVSGRTYPVELRYRPADDVDPVQAITDGVAELSREGPGDILVFLSGEREIRDTADALSGQPGLEVLPLYARLSAAEQYKVFGRDRTAGRRVVLATNIAETSVTVPGIRYVIDPGTARISRYSQRTKVQRLPIEPVSQASARQRAGRCGRTSDGICLRLYSEEDFESRPAFTEPEILRTNLASVLLRMAALQLGAIADFPFVDPPDPRQVADGLRLLTELGAIRPGSSGSSVTLTPAGRKLAELPVDPRLGRMILAAGDNGCVAEVLIITAALAIQDPRERPSDAREAADAQHRRFAEPGSDFLSLLTLWDYLRDQQRQLSSSAFRRLCHREYLHFLRVREWQDVHGQLQQAARDVGVSAGRGGRNGRGSAESKAGGQKAGGQKAGGQKAEGPKAGGRQQGGRRRGSGGRGGNDSDDGRYPKELADRVHQSLLAGLLSHIGMLDDERSGRDRAARGGRRRGPAEFAGARGVRFAIFPDSPQAKKPPRWVMAAELVETSRLWARTIAAIEPEWAESLAESAGLLRRTYSEPRWDARRAAVMAAETVTLYGVPIVAARPVSYGRVDPAMARDLFIEHALVEGDWDAPHAFLARNRRAREDAEEVERRARRRGLVADDRAVFDFYDQRIPKDVTSGRHFDSWWKKTRPGQPALLDLQPADLAGPGDGAYSPADYPASWGEFPLSYEFSPGEADDGVTVSLPLTDLFDADRPDLGWQVPGLRTELVTELIRGLPKDLRRHFIPAPDTARELVARLGEPRGELTAALSAELAQLTGVVVPVSAWKPGALPAHLRVNYRVLDDGREVAAGRDLGELRAKLRPRLQSTLAGAATEAGLTRTGLRTWDFGPLPRVFASGQVRGYPALADAGDTVDVRVYDTAAEADASMAAGTRRLLLLAVPSGVRSIASRLPVAEKMALSSHPYAGAAAMLDDCAAAAADEVIAAAGGPPRDAEGFARLVAAGRDQLAPATARVVEAVARALGEAHGTGLALERARPGPALEPAIKDMRAQFAALIYPGFIAATGAGRLPDLVRYLRAIMRRLDKVAGETARDADRMAVVSRVTAAYQEKLASLPPALRDGPDARAVRWQIEELRVSLFAQVIGTRGAVSEKRVLTAIDALGR